MFGYVSSTCGGSAKNNRWWNSEMNEAVLEKVEFASFCCRENVRSSVFYRTIKLKVKLAISSAKILEWKKFGDDL